MPEPRYQPAGASAAERPAVLVWAGGRVAEGLMREILLGLEEEGIPARVALAGERPAALLARRAARGSRLEVGVGLGGGEGLAVLHHRDLGERPPLMTAGLGEERRAELRRLGVNAARLAKGDPLVLGEECPAAGRDGGKPISGGRP